MVTCQLKLSMIRTKPIEERVSKEKDKEGIMGETYRADTEWPDKRATIKIDYQYIKKVGNYNDMVTTITHELGHGFGLGHNKDKNSLMSAYDDSDHRQTLPAKDIQKARGIYLALEHYELKEKPPSNMTGLVSIYKLESVKYCVSN